MENPAVSFLLQFDGAEPRGLSERRSPASSGSAALLLAVIKKQFLPSALLEVYDIMYIIPAGQKPLISSVFQLYMDFVRG